MFDTAVIFAAGKASRMNYCSKAMKIVSGKPLITYGLDALKACGIRNIFLVRRPDDLEILDIPLVWNCHDVRLEMIIDSQMQGAVMAHCFLPDTISYPIITLDCDIILHSLSLAKMLRECIERFMDAEISAAVAVVDNPVFGSDSCMLVKEGQVIDYNAKGLPNGVEGGYIFVWKNPIVAEIEEYYDHVRVAEDYGSFFEYYLSKYQVAAIHIDYLWDVDTPEMIVKTEKYLKETAFFESGLAESKVTHFVKTVF